jgi:sensor histidine kinase regulating citrate/malate metabolism
VEDVFDNVVGEFNMGITTIKELVNIMNGHLQIISEISKGTSFIIKLPLDNNKIKISGGV